MGKRKSGVKDMKGQKKKLPNQPEVHSNGTTRPETTDTIGSQQKKNQIIPSEDKENVQKQTHRPENSSDDDFDYSKSQPPKKKKTDNKKSDRVAEQNPTALTRTKTSEKDGLNGTQPEKTTIKARPAQLSTRRRVPVTSTSKEMEPSKQSKNEATVNSGRKRTGLPNVGPQPMKMKKARATTSSQPITIDLTQDDNQGRIIKPKIIKRFSDGTLDSWLIKTEKKEEVTTIQRTKITLQRDENTTPRQAIPETFSRKRGEMKATNKTQEGTIKGSEYEDIKVQKRNRNPLTDVSNQVQNDSVYDDRTNFQSFDPGNGGLSDIVTPTQPVENTKSGRKFSFKLKKETKSNAIAVHGEASDEEVTAKQRILPVLKELKVVDIPAEDGPVVESSSFMNRFFSNDHWDEISPEEAELIEEQEAVEDWLVEFYNGTDQNDSSGSNDAEQDISDHVANGSNGYSLRKNVKILYPTLSNEDAKSIHQPKNRAIKKDKAMITPSETKDFPNEMSQRFNHPTLTQGDTYASRASRVNKTAQNEIDNSSDHKGALYNDTNLKEEGNESEKEKQMKHKQPFFVAESAYAGFSRSPYPLQSTIKTQSLQKRKSSTNTKASSTVTSHSKMSSYDIMEDQQTTDVTSTNEHVHNSADNGCSYEIPIQTINNKKLNLTHKPWHEFKKAVHKNNVSCGQEDRQQDIEELDNDNLNEMTEEQAKYYKEYLKEIGPSMEEPCSDFAPSSGTDDELMSDYEEELSIDSGKNRVSTPTLNAPNRSDSIVAQHILTPNVNTADLPVNGNCPHDPPHTDKKYDKYFKECLGEDFTIRLKRTTAPKQGINKGNPFFNLETAGYDAKQHAWLFKCKEVYARSRNHSGKLNICTMITFLRNFTPAPLHPDDVKEMTAKLARPQDYKMKNLSTPTLDAPNRSDSTEAQPILTPNVDNTDLPVHNNCPHNPQHTDKKYDKYFKECLGEEFTLQLKRTYTPKKGINRGKPVFTLETDGYNVKERAWHFKCKERDLNAQFKAGTSNIATIVNYLCELTYNPLHPDDVKMMTDILEPTQRHSNGRQEFYDADLPNTVEKWVAKGDIRKITNGNTEYELQFEDKRHFNLYWTHVNRQPDSKTIITWMRILTNTIGDLDRLYYIRNQRERKPVESRNRKGTTEYLENSDAASKLNVQGWKSTNDWFEIPKIGIQLNLKGVARGGEKLIYYVRGCKSKPENEPTSIKALYNLITREWLDRPLIYEITNINGLSETVMDKLRRGPAQTDGWRYVYIIRRKTSEENLHKIGITVNIKNRLSRLKHDSDGIEHIVDESYLTPYGYVAECIAHHMLKENHFKNVIPQGKTYGGYTEWFNVPLQDAKRIVKRAVDIVTSLYQKGTYPKQYNEKEDCKL